MKPKKNIFAVVGIITILMLFGFGCGGSSDGDGGGRSYGLGKAIQYRISDTFTFLGATSIGDLNGDGLNDVVTVEVGDTPTKVFISYQDQNGFLSQLVICTIYIDNPYATPGDAVVKAADIGDVNDDGYSDLLVLCCHPVSHAYLAVLYQDPTTDELMFDTLISIGEYPCDLDIGDLNSNGLNDVVIKGGNYLSVLYQDIQGELGEPQNYDNLIHPSLLARTEVHIEDMDNDYRNDIIIQTDSYILAVIRQDPAGLLSNEPEYYELASRNMPSFQCIPFSIGDINNDGLNDIVALDSWNATNFNVFIQNASGTLNDPYLIDSKTQLNGIEIEDMDNDGLDDIIGEIVVIYPLNPIGYICIFYQKDSFKTYRSYPYLTSSGGGTMVHNALSIGDVNGDNLPDAVVSWSDDGIFVLPNITR